MNHGSLFSGIGGFDLAAEWMGWNNTFHCEWMPFPRKVLNHYWPNSISYEDITKTDFSIHRGTIDILTGGFPCQPYSSAGKRLGKEDERHLWPHMLRVISEINPTYVVGENVRGLTNWNGGVVFEEVCTDLESQGYTVQPILLPACAVGAPHRRDRVWFIAYSRSNGLYDKSKGISEWENTKLEQRNSTVERLGIEWNVTNSNSIRQHERECNNEEQSSQRGVNAFDDINENVGSGNVTDTCEIGFSSSKPIGKLGRQQRFTFNYEQRIWQKFPTQSPICGGDDGLPIELDGITFSKWRQESIKGYGNAIVPQVAYEIFKVIAEMDRLEKLQLKLF
jgi:DNA (cytosine-5)-methyltransferase 1